MKGERIIKKVQAYYDEHLDELQEQFPGEYIAIIRFSSRGSERYEVVYHHLDLEKLTEYVYVKYEKEHIFIDQVPAPRPLMTYEEYKEIASRRQSE